MKLLKIFLVFLLLVSCKNTSEGKKPNLRESQESENTFENYQNENFGFSMELNSSWKILESEKTGNPVINIYKLENEIQPPYGIREDAEIGFISILPEGLPVDGLSGQSVNLINYNQNPFQLEAIDQKKSLVYLLENGKAYAYFLQLKEQPDNWRSYGGIFIHPRVANFTKHCYDENGKEKSLEDCDNPAGSDKIRFTGEVSEQDMDDFAEIINSFQFKISEKEQISDLIRVTSPLPNLDINSPLEINGRAKGFWFFEATAPVELVDSKGKELAQGYIRAEGDWMTKDWVNFTGEIEFDAPNDERGYLVFYRSNPSGEAEHAQMYKMPVIFPPKK